MILVSLVFLFVYLFGAYAYGAATIFGYREVGPVWGGLDRESPPGARPRLDKPGLALFAISTVWFVLHTLIEFRNLSADTSLGWLEFGKGWCCTRHHPARHQAPYARYAPIS